MNILMTGATGFVGRALTQKLLSETGHHLRLVVRNNALLPEVATHPRVSVYQINAIDGQTDWEVILKDCDIVIHTAARVHMMKEAQDSTSAYDEVNVFGTINLARQANDAGVKRFIFLSSIKVNGEEQISREKYTPEDTPNPQDAYARSKHQAELGLLELSQTTKLEITIIRPPLIYGPMVKGNFKTMIHWLKKGVPLPLGNTANQRSFVSVYNLSDLIIKCITHPNAANQVFLVSDGKAISTTELLKKMSQALGVPARLFSLPPSLLNKGLSLLHKEAFAKRLLGSLELDISKTEQALGWQPRADIDDVLKLIAMENEGV